MLKIILLSLFFVISAFGFTVPADDPSRFVTDFPIYVQGDVGFIELALNAAAMLVKDSDFQNLTELALFIAVIIASWVSFKSASLVSLGKSTAIGIGGLGLMFAPVTTHIIDNRTNVDIIGPNYTTVANVPYLIALPASLTSNLSDPLQKLVYAVTVPIENGETAGISAMAIGNQDQIKKFMKALYTGASLKKTDNPTIYEFNIKLQQYIKECVMEQAPFYNYDVSQALISPRGDIFKWISPENLIAISENPNGDVAEFKNTGLIDSNGTATYTCGTIYNKIIADIPTVSTEVNKEVGSFLPKGLTIDRLAEGLVASGIISIADVNASAPANAMTTVSNYVMNIASIDTLQHACITYGGDGVRISQEITTLKSKALMQMEGTGGLNFFVEMLPNSMHFIYAIVLFLGVFVGISALAQPTMALTIYKGYFLSFVSFELVKVSQIIISNMTLYYSSTGAAAKLATLNHNGASLASLSSSYDYLATMTATSGLIGTMFIIAIPSIIYRGDFFGFLSGAVGSVGGKYLGNNLQTAQDAASQKQAGDIVMDNLKKDEVNMRRLKQMFGNDFEPNIGATDYYNKVQAQMSKVSQDAASMSNLGTVSNQSNAVMLQAQKMISANAQIGGSGKTEDARISGAMSGANTVGAMSGDVKAYNESGHNLSSFSDASMNNTRASHASSLGSAEGSKNSSFEALRENAQYSTTSSIQSAQKRISTLGGIDKAVATDVASAEKSAIGQAGDIAAWEKLSPTEKADYQSGITKQSIKALATVSELGANGKITETTAKQSGKLSALEMASALYADAQTLEQKSPDEIFNANKANALSQKKKSLADGKKLAETFGDDLMGEGSFEVTGKGGKKTTRKIGFDKMVQNEADAGIAQRLGNAEAFERTGFNMTAQNANYSSESGAKATDMKIKSSGGIDKAVASDVVAGGMAGTQASSTADKFGQIFDKESGKLRDKLAEGGEDAARAIKKAFEEFKQVTDAGADQSLRTQKGNASGYEKAQAKFGPKFAELTAESSTLNSAYSSMANINAQGGGEQGVENSAKLSYKMAHGATMANKATVAESEKLYGSYDKAQTVAATSAVDMAYSAFAGKTKSSKKTTVDDLGVEEVFEQKAMMDKNGRLTKEGMAANITSSHEQTAAVMTGFQAKVDNKMASANGGLTNKGVNIIGYSQALAIGQQSENYNSSTDNNARQTWADQTLERLSQKDSLGNKDKAVEELKKSGFIAGVDDNGKAVLTDLQTSMKSKIQGEALASANGGMSGLTLSDGTLVKTKMGRDGEGQYKARVDTDSSQTNKVGNRTDMSIPQELADKISGITGADILTTLGEITIGGAVIKKGLDFYNGRNLKNAKAGETFTTNQGETATADGRGNFTVDEEYTDKKGDKQTKKVRVQEGNLRGVVGDAFSSLTDKVDNGLDSLRTMFSDVDKDTINSTSDGSQKHNGDSPDNSNKNQSFHDEKSPSKNMSNSSINKAEMQWINTQQSKLNTSNDRGKAQFERLEQIKKNISSGKLENLDQLDNMMREKIGYNSNAQAKIHDAIDFIDSHPNIAPEMPHTQATEKGTFMKMMESFEAAPIKHKAATAANAILGTVESTLSNIGDSISSLVQSTPDFGDLSPETKATQKSTKKAQAKSNFFAMKNLRNKKSLAAATTVALGTVAAEASEFIGDAMNFVGGPVEILLNPAELGAGSDIPVQTNTPKSNLGKFELAKVTVPQDLSAHTVKNEDSYKGGIMDPTSQINGMLNIANTQQQQMASQQIQGEVYNVGGQIDAVKAMMDKMVKNPPNTTSEDVERLKKQIAMLRNNQN